MWRAISALILLTAGCAAPAPQVKRIVLLAPFESTYREVGYDALYPVKLALADEALKDIQLLSLDDGGTIERAVLHAQALASDHTVMLVLVAGPTATDKAVLEALYDIPVVVIGEWAITPQQGVFVLSSREIDAQITTRASNIYDAAALSDATSGEIFGLKSFAALSPEPGNIKVVTSAGPPSAEFRERLLASDLYVPEPGLLATLAYDTGTLAARIVSQSTTRADVQAALGEFAIEGLNGDIRFDADGYWTDAPMYEYRYSNGVLTLGRD